MLELIIYGIILIFFIILFIVLCKTTRVFIEKFACITFSIAFFTPFILYILDRFNLPSILFSKVDFGRWFSFLTSYISSVIGAIIGGMVTFMVLYFQIRYQRCEANEERRIHNMPLLVYHFCDSISYDQNKLYKDIYINYEPNNINNLYLKVENIGLNHAKKVFYVIKIENYCYSSYFESSPSILNVGNFFALNIDFGLGSGKFRDFDVCVKILYKDLLENCYSQDILLNCLNNSSNKEQKLLTIKNCIVDDAKVISEDEWNSFTNKQK